DYDVTTFLYAETTDPTWNGFLELTTQYTSRYRAYMQYPLWYDFWGNQTMARGFNGNLVCRQYDPARNVLIASMQSADFNSCNFDDPNNLLERYAYDSALRLTQVTHPDGSCTHYEYDGKGRLLRVKERDDCNPASPGDREEYVYDADGLVTEVDSYDQAG